MILLGMGLLVGEIPHWAEAMISDGEGEQAAANSTVGGEEEGQQGGRDMSDECARRWACQTVKNQTDTIW